MKWTGFSNLFFIISGIILTTSLLLVGFPTVSNHKTGERLGGMVLNTSFPCHHNNLNKNKMKITNKIEIETTNIEAIEYALNLAHQGYENEAILILGLTGLALKWNIDELFYYLKEGNINNEMLKM